MGVDHSTRRSIRPSPFGTLCQLFREEGRRAVARHQQQMELAKEAAAKELKEAVDVSDRLQSRTVEKMMRGLYKRSGKTAEPNSITPSIIDGQCVSERHKNLPGQKLITAVSPLRSSVAHNSYPKYDAWPARVTLINWPEYRRQDKPWSSTRCQLQITAGAACGADYQ